MSIPVEWWFFKYWSVMPLSLWLPRVCHGGWSGSCICISQCHHNCCCHLDGCLVYCFHDIFWFCHVMLFLRYLSLPVLAWLCLPNLRLLLLTPCNVISLRCNSADVVYKYALLTAYLQVYIKYEQLYKLLYYRSLEIKSSGNQEILYNNPLVTVFIFGQMCTGPMDLYFSAVQNSHFGIISEACIFVEEA